MRLDPSSSNSIRRNAGFVKRGKHAASSAERRRISEAYADSAEVINRQWQYWTAKKRELEGRSDQRQPADDFERDAEILRERMEATAPRIEQLEAEEKGRFAMLRAVLEAIERKTTCRSGHIMTDSNILLQRGWIICLDCEAANKESAQELEKYKESNRELREEIDRITLRLSAAIVKYERDLADPRRELMGPEEIVTFLGISSDTVLKLIEEKKLAARNIDGRWRIFKADIIGWKKRGWVSLPENGAAGKD